MNLIQTSGYEEMSKKAAVLLAAQLLRKPGSVLGLATGGTPVGTYRELVRMHREEGLDFSGATSFNLDEYWGTPSADPNSYAAYMEEHLFRHVNLPRDRAHLPDGTAPDPQQECKAYEERIRAAGGIDLQLLGIGHNGHIGFNEPADHFAAATHLVRLAESTIAANARYYESGEQVPRSAVTMGIGTIMGARSILLLASGEDKREIVHKALYGPVTPAVPASILQFHPSVTVIATR